MLLLLSCGLGLWVVYGVLREDIVIILANGISLALLAGLVYLKLLQTSS
jgi:MtN3 and saliva related transmembrane protein